MTPTEAVLTEAQERIRDVENFTQGTSARNRTGLPVSVRDASSCSFCVSGTVRLSDIHHIGRTGSSSNYGDDLLAEAASALYPDLVMIQGRPDGHVKVNDYGPPEIAHPRVMALFDWARAAARERGI